MWVKVDDDFTGHPKIFRAGAVLGGDRATGRVLAVWLEGMCWANHYLTGGRLLATAVLVFQHDRDPAAVATALEKAGLWDVADGGWQIHDYDKYQLNGEEVAAIRQARAAAGRTGGLAKARKHSANVAKASKRLANGWQTASKTLAKSCPVPVPVLPPTEVITRARELRAEPVSREQPLPPSGRAGGKPKPTHQPKTDGAWSCPHVPQCPSYDACIKRTLDDANARS